MTEQEIIHFLEVTGHLEYPHGIRDEGPWPTNALDIDSRQVKRAVESFQAMYAAMLEPLVARHHPQRPQPTIRVDGNMGPATEELMSQPRCACMDYGEPGTMAAIGSGNWKGCHNIGNFHAAIVKINTSGMPSFLSPIFDEVWRRVVQSYEEVGLRFIRDDNAARPQTNMSFVTPDGGWIGLAIVGKGETCSSAPIWLRLDKSYKPSNVLTEWTTLIKHELGHNCGLGHSSGGVMNSYIVKGLPVSWRGDPSWNLLAARFGGEPVPNSNPQRERVIAWKYPDGSYETITTIPDNGDGPFPSELN